MSDFVFTTTAQIISGQGRLQELGPYLISRGLKRVLVVSDRGIEQAGLLKRLDEILDAFAVTYFVDVEADPSENIVLNASAVAIESRADVIIGFGGGSSMDTAKVVSVLQKQEQKLKDIYGIDNIRSKRSPLILIPTTAGTGSEVTPISILTTGETTKAGIVSSTLLPDLALLDAQLTLGLPRHVTAATGIDAMVHAIEAYTSKIKKNDYCDMLALKALRLLSSNIEQACKQGDGIDARQAMLFGACLAGQAFANAPVAAVHALAYPLGGHFHIPHGLSNSLVLPHVMRFNAQVCAKEYAELANIILPEANIDADNESLARKLIAYLENLIESLGLPTQLRQLGIKESDLELLSSDAMLQTRLLVNNPRALNLAEARAIYQQAY